MLFFLVQMLNSRFSLTVVGGDLYPHPVALGFLVPRDILLSMAWLIIVLLTLAFGVYGVLRYSYFSVF
jgi:hypothetical protein